MISKDERNVQWRGECEEAWKKKLLPGINIRGSALCSENLIDEQRRD